MDGVRVILYLAAFLFLLLASFSAAREERSMRISAWTGIKEALAQTYNYLALVVHGSGKCSASILTETAVMTYCTGKPTKAYAGLVKIENTDTLKAGKQERDVTEVEEYTNDVNLKICKVEKWNFGDDVGFIKLHLIVKSKSVEDCNVAAFRTTSPNEIAHTTVQRIGDKSLCPGAKNTDSNHLYSKSGKETADKLGESELGGPAECNSELWGIIVNCEEVKTTDGDGTDHYCYSYVDIAKHSQWINEMMTEKPGGPGGSNSTVSSGYSIHSYLNKYSKWKVLWFLVPTIVTFLQY